MYNCKRGIDFTCTSADSFLLNHWYRYYKYTSIQYVPSLQTTKYFLCLLIYIWFGSNALKVSFFITIFFWRNLLGTRQLYLWWLCVFYVTLCVSLSGADIANVCNEAAIYAATNNKDHVLMSDMDYALQRIIGGPEKRSFVRDAREKKINAYYEAGRAVVSWLTRTSDAILKVNWYSLESFTFIYFCGLSESHSLKKQRFNQHKMLLEIALKCNILFCDQFNYEFHKNWYSTNVDETNTCHIIPWDKYGFKCSLQEYDDSKAIQFFS